MKNEDLRSHLSACRHLFQAKALWSIETADTSAAAAAASYTDVPRMFQKNCHISGDHLVFLWPMFTTSQHFIDFIVKDCAQKKLWAKNFGWTEAANSPRLTQALILVFLGSGDESFGEILLGCRIKLPADTSWLKKTSLNVLKRPVNVLKSWRVYSVLHYFSNSPAVAVDQRT